MEFDTGPSLLAGGFPIVIRCEADSDSCEIVGFGVQGIEYGRLPATVRAEQDYQFGGFGDLFDYQMGEALEVLQLDGFDFHCGPRFRGIVGWRFEVRQPPGQIFLAIVPAGSRGAGGVRW